MLNVLFDASNLASSVKNVTVQTLHEANRIVCKPKSMKVVVNFQYSDRGSALRLIAFSVASFGNLPDGGTEEGHLIVLMGENGKFSLLFFGSQSESREL